MRDQHRFEALLDGLLAVIAERFEEDVCVVASFTNQSEIAARVCPPATGVGRVRPHTAPCPRAEHRGR